MIFSQSAFRSASNPYWWRCAILLLCFLTSLRADELQLDIRIPLGLAHDGQILWISDAQSRTLTGYDVAQKKQLASRTLAYDVRDLAYWAPNLVTVVPNYVFVINPINGDLVDRIYLKGIGDPVAIAVDMHQAYIYNREDKKIHRVHLVDRLQFGSFTPEVPTDIRSMTFYKGFLWAIAKDGKAYKLSAGDGAQNSFLPLPERCYGISFVDGGMYVARPGQVRSVDFIETESYVAAARRNFTLAAELQIELPWSDEERAQEVRLQLKYSFLPVTAHQRIAGLRADPVTRFGRREDGSHTAEIVLEPKSSEKRRNYRLQFQATLYNLTHIFNPALIKQYFRNPELPDSVRPYLDVLALDGKAQATIENFRKEWLQKNDGKHPIFAIAALKARQDLQDPARCAALRAMGIPCRSMIFLDLDTKKTTRWLQAFVQPTGWVTISDKYDPVRPKEFPLANNELELYSPDDISLRPRLKDIPGVAIRPAADALVKFANVQVITGNQE